VRSKPRSVFRQEEALLVEMSVAVLVHDRANSGRASSSRGTERFVDVLHVNFLDVLSKVIKSKSASLSEMRGLNISVVLCAVVLFKCEVSIMVHKVVLVSPWPERIVGIVVPMSSGVSNHDSLQVDRGLECDLSVGIVLVDSPGEIRCIDSSIQISSDIDGVVSHLREFLEEFHQASEVI
jgi:hypothetical protein